MFHWILQSATAAGSTKYASAVRHRSTFKHKCFPFYSRVFTACISTKNNMPGRSKDVNLNSGLTLRTFALFHCVVAHTENIVEVHTGILLNKLFACVLLFLSATHFCSLVLKLKLRTCDGIQQLPKRLRTLG